MKKIRILFDKNDWGVAGGAHHSLLLLIKHLDKEKYDPFVTFARNSCNPLLEEFSKHATIIRSGKQLAGTRKQAHKIRPLTSALDKSGWIRKQLRLFLAFLKDLRQIPSKILLIRSNSIDIVHANNRISANKPIIWAACLCDIPVTCHERFLYQPTVIDRWTSRLVDTVICISDAVYKETRKNYASTRAVTIYNGVELDDIYEIRPPNPISRVACLGRIERWKGQQIFLEAATLLKKRGRPVTFLIVGAPSSADGEVYLKELHEIAKRNELNDVLRFTGHLNDIHEFLKESVDIVVHTSLEPEPFGRVLIEGMAHGKVVVASRIGAPTEIIENGVNGFLTSPGDANELANTLEYIGRHQELACTIAKYGRRTADNNYNAKTAAQRIEDVFDEVLQKKMFK